MAVMGLAGVLRGKKVRTTVSRKAVAAGDRVNRQFVAERPDQLWVADFTYVSTWEGVVYVAFIIDVFAGYIVGWRVSSSMETTFVLDALEQALWARRPSGTVTGISQQHDEQATQPDSVTAENYVRVVAEVMRRDGIELNGVDMRDIRIRVLELLAYRRRVAMYQESAKNTYQWKKPERLRR